MARVWKKPSANHLQTALKMQSRPIKFTEVLKGAAYLTSLSLLVFLRRRFGERIMGDLFVAGGFTWFCAWSYQALRDALFPDFPEPLLARFFPYAVITFCIFH